MPLSWNEIRNRAIEFAKDWEDESSEHAEAKTFWDQFFNVFGVNRRRLASFEQRVDKLDGGNGYIDLFWPGVLVAEHKSRGKNLDKAYKQATEYFHGLKDHELPRYVIVSDFANFRIYDLDEEIENEFPLSDLPNRVIDFGFIAGYERRIFREQDPVNIDAAEKLAGLHDGLLKIGYTGHDLEVYLVRILFCLFAEDTGIINPRGAFHDFIERRTSEDGSDLAARLSEIFEVLNTPPEQRLKTLDEQINDFPYVNGGLFSERLRTAAFDKNLRDLLLECCVIDWGQVSPAIFGSLFQGIMDSEMRRNLGAHYTSEKNIMKVIAPLFLDDLKDELNKCGKNKNKLNDFHDKLSKLAFFDPACGCGNFLVITYREIRLLELEVIKRLYGKQIKTLHLLDVIDNYVKVNVDQFHGIEIEEWPAQIARVAMWLIDHQMNELVSIEFGNAFVRIPLIKSANIVHDNALRIDWHSVVNPQDLNYILGNPPFRGKRYMSAGQKSDLKYAMDNLKGISVLDFVSAWFYKSVKFMEHNPKIETALVATNSICQGEQASVLWQKLYDIGMTINFAHRTFEWASEARWKAAVHCVIVGMSLSGRIQKSIYDYPNIKNEPEKIIVSQINPYLVDGPEFALPKRRNPVGNAPKISFGSMPNDKGHLLINSRLELDELVTKCPDVAPYIRLYYGSEEFINGLERWCLWLKDVPGKELRKMKPVLERLEKVKQARDESSREATKKLADTPMLFGEDRQPISNYIAIPKTSSEKRKYIPIAILKPEIVANTELFTIPDAGLYEFGVLTSLMHNAWTRGVGGRLKSDYRYSSSIIYSNFIWPEPNEKQIANIEKSAKSIIDIRKKYPDYTLADLYDPLAMPDDLRKAHNENDKAVDLAYTKKKFDNEASRVSYIFDLYKKLLD